MREKIICAAIWYDNGNKYEHQPKNIDSGLVVCGRRHHNVIALMAQLAGIKSKDYPNEQGFITTEDRFVDRREAMKIAIMSNQLTDHNSRREELYSEDLY